MEKICKYKWSSLCSGKLTAGLLLFIAGVLILSIEAAAYEYGKKVSCGSDMLCQSIEGKEFNMVLFSEFGSELAVLYDAAQVGPVTIAISGATYRVEKGTIIDAVHFVSHTSEYRTFTTSRAIKSVGWFGSERIDGMYIVTPVYDHKYSSDAAKYVIRGRDGKLELRIKPVYYFGDE